jgi:hypothetical protein
MSLILDYITNLEQGRQDYKDRFNLMAKFRDKALARELVYKSRIDKAIEYIRSEYTITDDDLYLALYSSDGTLDKLEKILTGGDEDE